MGKSVPNPWIVWWLVVCLVEMLDMMVGLGGKGDARCQCVLQIFPSVSAGFFGWEGKVGTDCPLSRTAHYFTPAVKHYPLPQNWTSANLLQSRYYPPQPNWTTLHEDWTVEGAQGRAQTLSLSFLFARVSILPAQVRKFPKIIQQSPCLRWTALGTLSCNGIRYRNLHFVVSRTVYQP